MSKFNKVTSWWPLRIERFDTSNHPVIKEGRGNTTKDVQLRLTHNEEQIIEGLANILECSKQQAVRIALHTCHDKAHMTPQRDPGPKEGSRDRRFKVKLTSYEVDLLEALDGKAGNNLRHIVWHTASLIKAGKLTRIPGCRRRSEKEKLSEYNKANKGKKGSKLTALKDAAAKARMAAVDAAQERYDELGEYADNLRGHFGAGFKHLFGDDNGKIDMDLIAHHMTSEGTASDEEELQEIYAEKDRKRGIRKLALQYSVWTGDSVEACMEQATEDWDAEHEEIDEEDLDLSWFDDIKAPANPINWSE